MAFEDDFAVVDLLLDADFDALFADDADLAGAFFFAVAELADLGAASFFAAFAALGLLAVDLAVALAVDAFWDFVAPAAFVPFEEGLVEAEAFLVLDAVFLGAAFGVLALPFDAVEAFLGFVPCSAFFWVLVAIKFLPLEPSADRYTCSIMAQMRKLEQ